ncbi:hypothetical protein VTK56DRAFT_8098 [Thermocarpiscus australiensis]
MRFLTALAFLAATAAALPAEPQQGGANSVGKRETCDQAFPSGCANICCEQEGGCSFLNCADSYCHYFDVSQPECICQCHYG